MDPSITSKKEKAVEYLKCNGYSLASFYFEGVDGDFGYKVLSVHTIPREDLLGVSIHDQDAFFGELNKHPKYEISREEEPRKLALCDLLEDAAQEQCGKHFDGGGYVFLYDDGSVYVVATAKVETTEHDVTELYNPVAFEVDHTAEEMIPSTVKLLNLHEISNLLVYLSWGDNSWLLQEIAYTGGKGAPILLEDLLDEYSEGVIKYPRLRSKMEPSHRGLIEFFVDKVISKIPRPSQQGISLGANCVALLMEGDLLDIHCVIERPVVTMEYDYSQPLKDDDAAKR